MRQTATNRQISRPRAPRDHWQRQPTTHFANPQLDDARAPDIQEILLFLPRLSEGTPEISEESLRKITMLDDWEEQRKTWREMGFSNLFQNA